MALLYRFVECNRRAGTRYCSSRQGLPDDYYSLLLMDLRVLLIHRVSAVGLPMAAVQCDELCRSSDWASHGLKKRYYRQGLVVPALGIKNVSLNRTMTFLRLRDVVCTSTCAFALHVREYRCVFACQSQLRLH